MNRAQFHENLGRRPVAMTTEAGAALMSAHRIHRLFLRNRERERLRCERSSATKIYGAPLKFRFNIYAVSLLLPRVFAASFPSPFFYSFFFCHKVLMRFDTQTQSSRWAAGWEGASLDRFRFIWCWLEGRRLLFSLMSGQRRPHGRHGDLCGRRRSSDADAAAAIDSPRTHRRSSRICRARKLKTTTSFFGFLLDSIGSVLVISTVCSFFIHFLGFFFPKSKLRTLFFLITARTPGLIRRKNEAIVTFLRWCRLLFFLWMKCIGSSIWCRATTTTTTTTTTKNNHNPALPFSSPGGCNPIGRRERFDQTVPILIQNRHCFYCEQPKPV